MRYGRNQLQIDNLLGICENIETFKTMKRQYRTFQRRNINGPEEIALVVNAQGHPTLSAPCGEVNAEGLSRLDVDILLRKGSFRETSEIARLFGRDGF